ncbi:MAG: ABC transporter ATP-binding protein, partial [Planctomycetota bacterium]
MPATLAPPTTAIARPLPTAEPTRPAHVAVRALAKSYRTGSDPVPVLRGVDFAVAPGEMVSIVGQSGS